MFSLKEKADKIVADLNKDLVKLKKKSDDALSTFRETVEDMEQINAKIDERIVIADNQIAGLNSLKESLSKHKSDNERIKNKIMDFLG